MGQVAYTPELKTLISAVRFWKYVCNKKEGRRVSSRLLARTMKKANITQRLRNIMQLDSESIRGALQSCYRQYSEYKMCAVKKRKSWLEELAEAWALSEAREKPSHCKVKSTSLSPQQATSKHLRMITATESMRKMHRRISHAVGRKRMAGVSMMIAPDLYGNWNELFCFTRKWKVVRRK